MSIDDEITMLRKDVARLNARVDELSTALARAVKASREVDELLRTNLKMIERDQAYAFERIQNIELKFFPNLAADIRQTYDVIGEGDDKALNPLDRRKP